MLTMLHSNDDLVSRHPPEVGHARDGIRQLLNLLKVVGHGHGLPYLRVVRHPAEVTWGLVLAISIVCLFKSVHEKSFVTSLTWRGEPLGRTGVATWVERRGCREALLAAGQEMPRERPACLSLLARAGQPRYHDAKKSAHFDPTPPVGMQNFEISVLKWKKANKPTRDSL